MRVWPYRPVLILLILVICGCQKVKAQTTTSGAHGRHPNFDLPNNFSGDQFFGQILGANGPPTNLMGNNTRGDNTRRLIQLRAELRF
jgi:hypothetical protein